MLVPLAGGPNGAFALEIASILAEKDEGEIVIYTVTDGRKPLDPNQFMNEHQDRIHLPRKKISTKTAHTHNVAQAILKESKNYDLIVLGYTGRPMIYQVAGNSIPDIVARRSTTPVLIAKAAGGIRSWIHRWI